MRSLNKNSKIETIGFDLSDVSKLVKEHLLPLLIDRPIITFSGPLGVGKTTIIKELLRQSGVAGVVDSPTFGYVKGYKSEKWGLFNHFDLYRLSGVDDFINAGFEEYLNKNSGIVLIEWPEVIDKLLMVGEISKRVYSVDLKYASNDCMCERVFVVKKNH